MFFYIVLSLTFLAHFGETSDRCLFDDDSFVLHVSGRCYWTVSGFTSFADAHKHCQADGGMLAEIPDQAAQTAIEKWLENNQNHRILIWIGVNDMNGEGNFVNMLNETVNYTNWALGEPNIAISFICGLSNYDCDCVMIKSGKWYDTPCSFLFHSYHALCSQRYNIEQTSKPLVPYTSVHTSTLSTITTTTTTTTDLSTKYQTSEKITDHLTTKNHITVSQTSEQITSVGTTLHVNQQRECMCPCSRMKNLVIIKNEAELLTKIDNMKKELAVNKSSLSSSIRKKTSAVDPRPSASIVGGTISVVIIATVVGLIVLSDLTRVINFCWKTISKRCNRKTRGAQKGKV